MDKILTAIRKFIVEEKLYVILLLIIICIYSLVFFAGNREKTPEEPSVAMQKIKEAEETFREKSEEEGYMRELLEKDKKAELMLISFTAFIFFGILAGLALDIGILANFFYKKGSIRRVYDIGEVAWGIKDIFRICILFVALGLFLSIFLGILKHGFFKNTSDNLFMVLHTTITDFAALIFIVYFVVHKYKNEIKALGINISNWFKDLFLGITGYLAVFPIFILIIVVLVMIANMLAYEPPPHPIVEVFVEEEKRSPGLIKFSIFLACVVGPIIEEIFFRGFCYPAIKKRWGMIIAMVVTAAGFALIHQSTFAFWPIFVLGIVLAYVYEKRGTLIPSMVMHVIHNSIFIGYFFLIKRSFIDQMG